MIYQPSIRQQGGQEQIFCSWRRKFVRLTPEEWVRQHILHLLVEQYSYPAARIGVEYSITVAGLSKRCDAVVFNSVLEPVCIIEFKRQEVPLTQKVQDQVAVYNRKLNVNYFILSSGIQTIVCKITDAGYEYLPQIPTYEQLCQKN